MNDAAVMERLPELLPPGWRPASSPVVDHLFSLIVVGSGCGVPYHVAELSPRRVFPRMLVALVRPARPTGVGRPGPEGRTEP